MSNPLIYATLSIVRDDNSRDEDIIELIDNANAIQTTPNPSFRIDKNGNIGVGIARYNSANSSILANVHINSKNNNNPIVLITKQTTNMFVIDSSGNVGIGLTNPTQILDVNGTIKATLFSGSGASLVTLNASNITSGTLLSTLLPATISSNTTGNAGTVTNGVYTTGSTMTGDLSFTGATRTIGSSDNNAFNIKTNNATRLTILNSGYVGIGTSTPTQLLDINGTVKATLFSGSGASLTALSASNITTGTLLASLLPVTISANTTGNAGTVTNGVYTIGNQTIAGIKTFSSTISGSITGNADTVTNGVYTIGDQTIAGIKTFSNTISGSITGNAGTLTNGVYTVGDQTITGIKTFSSTISGSITGNAGTVTNGVYTIGNQTIAGTKTFSNTISGSITGSAGTLDGTTKYNLFNSMGTNHGTYTDFNAIPNFGNWFIVGTTNSPGVNSASQYYTWNIGLGAQYPWTGTSSYGAQFAIGRNVTTPYLCVRYRENNILNAWQRLSAGYADSAGSVTNGVYTTGDQTIAGIKTFSSTISGTITGNAGTVTNGVYTIGDQTIAGIKTFSSTISGSITGNAETVTNGVYTTGDQTIAGTKTFSSTISGSITGNAVTVSNGVYTTGSTMTGDLSFTGATRNIGSSDNNAFAIKTNNATRLTILSNGNVGIGITNPLDKLDIDGCIAISGGTTNFSSVVVVDAGNKTNTYFALKDGGTGSDWCYIRQIGASNQYKLAFDMHDDNECKICFRKVLSTATPDVVTEVFSVDDGNVSFSGTLQSGTVPVARVSGLSTVATSGQYSDLSGKPTIPTSFDYTSQITGKPTIPTSFDYTTQITGKPSLATVATTGLYSDLSGRPIIPSPSQWITGGANIYYNGGNVGIGNTNPSELLHVSGNARIEGNLTINGTTTIIDTNTSTTEQLKITNDGTGPAVIINQTGAQPILDVQDDGVSALYIEDGGNVGIGTTDPTQKLDVVGNINLNNYLYMNGKEALKGDDAWLRLNQSGNFTSGVYTPNNMRVDANLYVGSSTNYLSYPTGDYGTIQVNGNAKGNWEGYSIDGRVVFMHNTASTEWGINNDVNNEWMIRGILNAQVELYYDNSNKLETTNEGVNVTGVLRANSKIAVVNPAVYDHIQLSHNGATGYLDFGGAENGFKIRLNTTGSTFPASSYSDVISSDGLGNVTFNGRLDVYQSNDAANAEIRVFGVNQGTGRIYIGQSLLYGGGIEFNGDINPATTGAGADYITLYRRDNGTDSWTARNAYGSDDWEFRGALTIGGNITISGNQYDQTTDVASGSASKTGTWTSATTSAWSPTYHIGGTGNIFTTTNGVDTAGSETIIFNVPTGKSHMYINHLPWDGCGYFDVWGLYAATNTWLWICRINNYQPNTTSSTEHSGTTVNEIGGVNRFSQIRLNVIKGRIHLMGVGWSQLKNGVTNGGFTGYLHWDNLVGTPTAANITLTRDTAAIIAKNTNNVNYSIISCLNPAGYGLVMFLNGTTRSADGGTNTGTVRNDVGSLRLQSNASKGITIAASTGNSTFDGLVTINKSSTANPDTGHLYCYNPNNSAGQHAIVGVRVAGSSSGNAYYSMDIANEFGWSMGLQNSDNCFYIRRSWLFDTSGTYDTMKIDTTGNIGIGKSPSYKLDVNGSFNCTTLYVNGTAFTESSQWTTSGTSVYYNNPVTIGSSTITTGYKLDVNGNAKIGDIVAHRDTFDHSTGILIVTHRTPTSASVLNDPQPVLHLCREGTGGQAYGARATFSLSRYENSATNSRSRLDIILADGGYDDVDVMRLYANGDVYLYGKLAFRSNDTWLRLNPSNSFTSGTYIGNTLRVDGGLYIDGTNYFDYPTGDYGSVQINATGKNNWEGYSIDGRVVFMHDGSTGYGIYNDVDNQWGLYGVLNSYVRLYHAATERLETTGTGIAITGELTCTDDITAFYSDERLKTVTEEIKDVLPQIDKLIAFKYKGNDTAVSFGFDNEKTHIGLSAQKVRDIYPELVDLAPFDTELIDDKKKSKSGENYLTLKYERLVPILLQGIKELHNENINMKNDIKKLKELHDENINIKNDIEKLKKLHDENINMKNDIKKLKELHDENINMKNDIENLNNQIKLILNSIKNKI